MKMLKRNRKLRFLLCLTTIISLLFTSFAPGVALAVEYGMEQAAWQKVLDMDLTQYEGERFSFDETESVEKDSSALDDRNTLTDDAQLEHEPAWDDANQQLEELTVTERISEETYETDRFIVKYKNSATPATVERALRQIDLVEQVEAVALPEVAKQPLQSAADSDPELSKVAVIRTEGALTLESLEEQLGATVMRDIVYIQPDYELTFYTLDQASLTDAQEELPLNKQGDSLSKSEVTEQLPLIENEDITSMEDEDLPVSVDEPVEEVVEVEAAAASGVIVALLDTGVDTQHPDLLDKLTSGYDFVNGDESINDEDWYYDQGHGTAMAGILAAGGATVMPLKVFQGGKAYTSDIIAAIAYAEAHGARIANLSFGTRFNNPALAEAMAQSGLLFVAAAGNMLVNIDRYPVYPAALELPNVLTVAAVAEDNRLARFSNYGVARVDLAASGTGIRTAWLEGASAEQTGTSVSAALVSTAAAQTVATYEGLDAAQLKERLLAAADRVTGLTDKLAQGRLLNATYAASANSQPNTAVLDIPDDEPLPEINPDGDEEPSEEEYEEYGAEGLSTYRAPVIGTGYPVGFDLIAVGTKIYAMGGYTRNASSNTYVSKVKIYDTLTDTWSEGANFPYPAIDMACVAVGTNIYCIGGRDGEGKDRAYVRIYDTLTDTWDYGTAYPHGITGASAVVYEGEIYIAGGRQSITVWNWVYKYNISRKEWTQLPGLQVLRNAHSAFVYEGKMYLSGGSSDYRQDVLAAQEEIYDLRSPHTSQLKANNASVFGSSLILDGDRLTAIGGGTAYTRSRIIRYYRMSTRDSGFTKLGLLLERRNNAKSAQVGDTIYVAGGNVTNTMEAIEVGYSELQDFPKPLSGFQTADLNGNIYILGGRDAGNNRNQEMFAYQPAHKSWQQKASLPATYTEFVTASVLNKLYLWGRTTAAPNQLEIRFYDPQTDSWSAPLAQPPPRLHSAAKAFGDKIYAFNNASAVVDVFNSLTGLWETAQARPAARPVKRVERLGDYLYLHVDGGLQRYAPAGGTWETRQIADGYSFIAAAYQDIFLLKNSLAGNQNIARYYPDEDVITQEASFFPGGPEQIENICTVDNKIYLFLGSPAEAMVEYMPPIHPWLEISQPDFVHASAASAVVGEDIYIAGGEGYHYGASAATTPQPWQCLKTFFVYHKATDTWEQKANLSRARSHAAGVFVNGKFYVIGGKLSDGSATDLVEEYDPATGRWTTRTPISKALYGLAAVPYGNKILLIFGHTGSANDNKIYEYDPVSGDTTQKLHSNNIYDKRHSASAVWYNDKVYISGGKHVTNDYWAMPGRVYDPVLGTMTAGINVPNQDDLAVSNIQMAVVDNKMYVIGGCAGGYSKVLQYDEALGLTFLNDLPDVLEGAVVAPIGGGIYIINGKSDLMLEKTAGRGVYTTAEAIEDYPELVHLGSEVVNPSGNLARNYTDYSYSAFGFTVDIGRTYNSSDKTTSFLGQGWSFSLDSKIVPQSRGHQNSAATVYMPNGSVYTFDRQPDGSYTARNSRANLVLDAQGTGVLTTPDHYKYHYLKYYLTKMQDPNGNCIDIFREGSLITAINDSNGSQIHFKYREVSSRKRLEKIAIGMWGASPDFDNPLIQYVYTTGEDGALLLSKAISPHGSTEYIYEKRLASTGWSLIDELAQVNMNGALQERFTYVNHYGQYKIKSAMKPLATETYDYNALEGTVTTTTGSGSNAQTNTTYFDSAFYPIRTVDAAGGTTRTEYNLSGAINRYGEVKSFTDRNGATTFYDYDERGNVTRVINPDWSSRTYTYYHYNDGTSDLKSETDENGVTTYYEYDANHNLITKARAIDGVAVYSATANPNLFEIERYTYGTFPISYWGNIGGLMQTAVDAAGFTTTYSYVPHGVYKYGYDVSARDGLERQSTQRYTYVHNDNRLMSETSARGYATSYGYDQIGRLTARTNVNTEQELFNYDTFGNLTQHRTPTQNQASNSGTRYTYNSRITGLANYSFDALDNRTDYAYDQFGNLIQETKPNGSMYLYTYDGLNRPLTKSYKESSTTAAILLEKYDYPLQTDGTARTETTVYFSASSSATSVEIRDYAGRLIKTIQPDGSEETVRYHANGLVAEQRDGNGNSSHFTYDKRNLLTAQWLPQGNGLYALTTYTYDQAGRKITERAYTRPLALNAAASGTSKLTQYTYNADSTVQKITVNSQAETVYEYNADKLVSKEKQLISANRWRITDYVYDHRGNVTQSITYQEAQDIDGGSGSGLLTQTTANTYDRNGNLTRTTYPNNQQINYTYDLLDRPLTESRTVKNENGSNQTVTKTKVYDNMGNLISEQNEKGYYTFYTYNKQGFVTRVTDALNAVTQYGYDYQGRVIKETAPRALGNDLPSVPERLTLTNAPPGQTPPAETNYAGVVVSSPQSYTTYTYDGRSRLLTRQERYQPLAGEAARTITAERNTYDGNGNLLSVQDALGHTTHYEYDGQNRLVGQRNALNEANRYAYDALGRQTEAEDALGVVTEQVYDLFGNVTERKVAGQRVWRATYDLIGNKLAEYDGNNNITSYTYTLQGQLRQQVNAAGYSIRQWYNNMGENTRSLDSLARETVMSYDWGRLLSTTQRRSGGTEALSRSTRYDVLGNAVYQTDERGLVTRNYYDKLSRLRASLNPLNQLTLMKYDAAGNLTEQTDWLGNRTVYRYDLLNRLIASYDATGARAERLTYTDTHQQASSTDALGHITQFSYDALGRLTASRDAEGYSTSQSYDARGNIRTKTDGNGNISQYHYDVFNRLERVTLAGGRESHYTYDTAGNMLSQQDGGGNLTQYGYSNLNLLAWRADPGGVTAEGFDEERVERYTYEPDGKLQSRRDKNGVTTSYSYDIHGRKLTETVAGQVTRYTYDNAGNTLTVTDATGTISRTYDALNRALTKTAPQAAALSFGYDITAGLAAGRVAESSTLDGRSTVKVYDQAGRLAEVREGSSVVSSYSYYANGSLMQQTLPGGVTANYEYYANNRLHKLMNKRGSSTLENYQYAYDGAGNITAKRDIKGLTSYTYTELCQLESVSEPSGKLTAYAYDNAGNRSLETVTEGGVTTETVYEYNEQNRLTRTEASHDGIQEIDQYYYDAAGNILARSPEMLQESAAGASSVGLSLLGQPENAEEDADSNQPSLYRYNEKNQMVEAIVAGSTVESSYHAEGLRVSKTADGVTTRYTYEYDRVLKEQDSAGSVAYNTYGTNLLSRELDGEKVYYLYNGHSDVTALLTASGTVAASYYYDAFGVIVEQNGNFGNPYRYSGYHYDEETQLYDLKARFYDAKIARFMQEDTYHGQADDPLSLNLYAYCRNNPLIYWDPTGHKERKADSRKRNRIEPVREYNEKRGNTVEWNEDDPDNRTITITQADGYTVVLEEGRDFAIDSEGTAFYDPTRHEVNLSYDTSTPNGNVKLMQRRLNALGVRDANGNALVEDGIFGANTQAAVNSYKEQAGLWNHDEYAGIVGETTWTHIFNAAPAGSSPPPAQTQHNSSGPGDSITSSQVISSKTSMYDEYQNITVIENIPDDFIMQQSTYNNCSAAASAMALSIKSGQLVSQESVMKKAWGSSGMSWASTSEVGNGYTLELSEGTYSSEEDALKAVYDELAAGNPVIYKVYNPNSGNQHWVTIYGFEIHEDSTTAMEAMNFLTLDPNGATQGRLNDKGYQTFHSDGVVKGRLVFVREAVEK